MSTNLQSPGPFEAAFNARVTSLTVTFACGSVIAAVLAERVANDLTGSIVIRVACVLATVVVMWRTYTSYVTRLVLTETGLVLTCVRSVVCYDLTDIDVKLSCMPSKSTNAIRIKTGRRPWRRRYWCEPRTTGSLAFEQKLLQQLRARGVPAVSTTIVLWP